MYATMITRLSVRMKQQSPAIAMLTNSSVLLNVCIHAATVSLLHHACDSPQSLEGVFVRMCICVCVCACTGLLGGAVYVNAFTLISRHVDPLRREFSLAAASLGDSLGIAFADIAGILIQVHILRCMYFHFLTQLVLLQLRNQSRRQGYASALTPYKISLRYFSDMQGCLYKANKIPGASFAC